MRKKGFTLVELVITIVIVGILSIVSVPIYRGYVKRAMATEANALMAAIETAERVYYAQHKSYYFISDTNFSTVLDVDSRSNKYFKKYNIIASGGDSFVATTSGTGLAGGISATLIGPTKK